jgi:hypothetical protein
MRLEIRRRLFQSWSASSTERIIELVFDLRQKFSRKHLDDIWKERGTCGRDLKCINGFGRKT